jgi:glycosyltransferase involved in cell wall biosynthesis
VTALACSVVVPTYNAAATLPAQLGALAEQTIEAPFEVVISDNGSTDDSASVAAAWCDRLDLRVVDASRGRGVSVARNVGIEAAATDLVLLCDADDVVSPGWVEAMSDALRAHPFVGGSLETRTLSGPSASWVPFPEMTTELPQIWGGRRWAFGGNLGMHRRVFEAVGGFAEDYPAGAEELDFAWRAGEAGFTPVYVPEALIHYRIRSDVRGVLRQQFSSGQGTAQLYGRFRPSEVVLRSRRAWVRRELWFLRRFPWRGGREARLSWLMEVAFEAGKLVGARRAGTPAP